MKAKAEGKVIEVALDIDTGGKIRKKPEFLTKILMAPYKNVYPSMSILALDQMIPVGEKVIITVETEEKPKTKPKAKSKGK